MKVSRARELAASGMMEKLKLKVNRVTRPGALIYQDDLIYFKFGYWKGLNEAIKNMAGRKYHGFDDENPRKIWSIPITDRNMFQLNYLRGENSYAAYDAPLVEVTVTRSLYKHQIEMLRHCLTRRQCIIAGEMGTGKTLTAIELAERVFKDAIQGFEDHAQVTLGHTPDFAMNAEKIFWWVGPRSALVAVEHEFKKWKSRITPRFMTYEGLTKIIKNWVPNNMAPKMVVFDESSKIKTPTAQRSQAARELVRGIREDYGDDGVIIEMSGSPAPKSPADWWHQCEVAQPGFLVEGDIYKFKNRLGIIHEKENPITGGKYPHLVAWRDDVNKCNQCGQFKDHEEHMATHPEYHVFEPSKNEVSYLYERMNGLVLVKFKKDCLDLPEKLYRVVNVKPTPSALRASKLIADVSPTAIKALTQLRELSDGFQYVDVVDGTQPCPQCNGRGEAVLYLNVEGERTDSTGKQVTMRCPQCSGRKVIPKMVRTTKSVPCPKDNVILNELETHDEIGRIVIYAGFTASIDRVTALCLKKEWGVIRVDGRGWHWLGEGNVTDYLECFQESDQPRVAFVGHPGSAGMGLTLTRSPTIIYYSNDFSAENRIQSEDRIHRIGMDVNRGATIIDIVHLNTDAYILENLKKKRKLQSLSLGEIQQAMEQADDNRVL